jgi:ubiquinone/menaquinone biosynthesis C-methylase UbiE
MSEMMDNFSEARTYDSNSSEQREDGFNLINLLTLEQGSKVLDLGCGTGYLTKLLANRVGPTGEVRCVHSYQVRTFLEERSLKIM